MSHTVTIDHITHDPKRGEYALYLVEDGPWESGKGLDDQLKSIQSRVLGAIDIVINGQLANLYPESFGKRVRIQVDSPSGAPKELDSLIHEIDDQLTQSMDYSKAIKSSPFLQAIRVVTGDELGRFR